MATYPPSGFAVAAIICDSAASAEGKLYIQGGGWNILMSPVFPFSQPRIGVGAIVSVPYHATNKNHVLELRLEDQDGERLPIGPTVMSDTDGTTKSPMAINLDQPVFQSPGAYSFVLTINDEEMERLTFRVLGPASAGITATGGD